MGKAAHLKDWKAHGFESKDAMQRAIAGLNIQAKGERARFKDEVLRGPKILPLADRICRFDATSPGSSNPYFIEGPASIGVSGGRTSGYMLYRILEAHDGQLPDSVLPIFQTTGKERDETLEFLHEIETRWDVPLIWLEFVAPAPGEPPRKATFRVVDYETAFRDSWPDTLDCGRRRPFNAMFDMFRDYRAAKGLPPVIPNVRQRMCTANMKMKTQARYLRSLGWHYWDAVAGIRADEPRRVANARLSLASERAEPIFPLNSAGVTEPDVLEWWSQQDFDLQLSSGEGNCDLCFLKSVPVQLALLHKFPERAEWWIAREDEVGDVFRRDLSRNTEGPRGFRKMLKRAQELTLEKIDELKASGVYPDSLPCSCTD